MRASRPCCTSTVKNASAAELKFDSVLHKQPKIESTVPSRDGSFNGYSVRLCDAAARVNVEASKGSASAYVCSNCFFSLLANYLQTLRGSFSAVSKPNFASKYSFESS